MSSAAARSSEASQSTARQSLEERGFASIPALLSPPRCLEIASALQPLLGRAGRRGLLEVRAVADLARELAADPRVAACSERSVVAVDALLFDKTPATNWKVTWHQDLAMRIGVRTTLPGYSAWNCKHGAWYAQPPESVLRRMSALRVHLDDCGEQEGPLRVLVGSHRSGKMLATEDIADRFPAFTCKAAQGDAWLMKPLLMHSSGQARRPSQRRVLHLVYAPEGFPAC